MARPTVYNNKEEYLRSLGVRDNIPDILRFIANEKVESYREGKEYTKREMAFQNWQDKAKGLYSKEEIDEIRRACYLVALSDVEAEMYLDNPHYDENSPIIRILKDLKAGKRMTKRGLNPNP